MRKCLTLLMIIVALCKIVNAQKILSLEEANFRFEELVTEEKNRLNDIRCGRQLTGLWVSQYHYFVPTQFNISQYEKMGFRKTINDLYSLEMRKRVLQLLRNQYNEGEMQKSLDWYMEYHEMEFEYIVDSQANSLYMDSTDAQFSSFLKSEKFSMFKDSVLNAIRHERELKAKNEYLFAIEPVLALCGKLHDPEIQNELFSMYRQDSLKNCQKYIAIALSLQGIEKYQNEILEQNAYSQSDDIRSQYEKVENLYFCVESDTAFYEIAKYLKTNKYVYMETADGDVEDIPTSAWVYAFGRIVENVTNPSLFEYIDMPNPWTTPNTGHWEYINEERRDKMYEWMMNNYGNYQLWQRW